MAIKNMAEYFGCDASEVFEEKEQAEGYLAGTAIAARMHAMMFTDYNHRSRHFREGILRALRDQI